MRGSALAARTPVRPEAPVAAKPAARPRSSGTAPKRKLSFKEKHELEVLPRRIEALEIEKHQLFELMGSPSFYTKRADEVARAKERLDSLDAEIRAAYGRWAELEVLAEGAPR